MTTKTLPIALVLVSTLGLGARAASSEAATAAQASAPALATVTVGASGVPAREAAGARIPDAGADAADPGADPDADPDAVPEIDFPLLSRARPVSLIGSEFSFPERLRALDGRRVTLVGFMAPFDSLDSMQRCMIFPTYVGCKFCTPPQMNQVVYVTQGDGERRTGRHPFIESASRVTGTLRLTVDGSDHEGQRMGFVYAIENAEVVPYEGEAPERPPGHEEVGHEPVAVDLEPVAPADLVAEVAELLGREPRRPIEFRSMSPEAFAAAVRARVEATFPESTRAARADAFRLLGLMPGGVDWADVLSEHELTGRVVMTNESGDRIDVLATTPPGDLYTRLELVGEIADAIARQHFPGDGPGAAADVPGRPAASDEDARRARAALHEGFRSLAMVRYARERDIPSAARAPDELIQDTRVRRRGDVRLRLALESTELGLWLRLPGLVGSFFVDSLVGDFDPIAGVDPALDRPPSTTMEFFRPRWYHDAALWRADPVAPDFADGLLETPPILTDVLGIAGLVPVLRQWYPVDVAASLAGGWAGDRWALWRLPDGTSALLLETRWQDEGSALAFREAVPETHRWRVVPPAPGSTRVRLVRADEVDVLERLLAAVQDAPAEP